jgi:excinuclease ABC subunit C
MAIYNAKFNLENKRNIYKNQVLKKIETIEELGELLNIDTPYRIESFDNSNLYGEYPVSAMVCYIDGKPAPKEFRKYHIKTVEGPNDYASMKEVIYRRYFRLLMEDEKMPDLILMDGGLIQVNAAKEVLESLGLDINVAGMQKNDKHKISKLYFEGEYYDVDKNSKIFLLLADISQRVHDFAISFFRSNKAKGIFSSILDNIDGLGEKRKEQLLKHFINIEKIKEASIEELIEAKMPKNVAENIYNYFHGEEND